MADYATIVPLSPNRKGITSMTKFGPFWAVEGKKPQLLSLNKGNRLLVDEILKSDIKAFKQLSKKAAKGDVAAKERLQVFATGLQENYDLAQIEESLAGRYSSIKAVTIGGSTVAASIILLQSGAMESIESVLHIGQRINEFVGIGPNLPPIATHFILALAIGTLTVHQAIFNIVAENKVWDGISKIAPTTVRDYKSARFEEIKRKVEPAFSKEST